MKKLSTLVLALFLAGSLSLAQAGGRFSGKAPGIEPAGGDNAVAAKGHHKHHKGHKPGKKNKKSMIAQALSPRATVSYS